MMLCMIIAVLLASVPAIFEVIIIHKSPNSVVLSYMNLHKVELISSCFFVSIPQFQCNPTCSLLHRKQTDSLPYDVSVLKIHIR